MKRAWPYAVALAIVVTGCYLALTPLLRSLSPGATPSSSSLTQIATTATVGQAKGITNFVSSKSGQAPSRFANDLPATVKKAKKKAATTAPTGSTTPSQTDTTTTGSAKRLVEHADAAEDGRQGQGQASQEGQRLGQRNRRSRERRRPRRQAAATAPRPAARTATRPATEHDAVERRRIAL